MTLEGVKRLVVSELKAAMEVGVEVYDSHADKTFTCHARLTLASADSRCGPR
jgi:hypothetical protein